jgi:hypothetical protein
MNTATLEGTRTLEPMHMAGLGKANRPGPEWVRGTCPECGDALVSNWYYLGGRGYVVCWECWSSLGRAPRCTYRRVL